MRRRGADDGQGRAHDRRPRPVVRRPGVPGRGDVHRQRPRRATRADPRRPWRRLGATAAVGRPAGRLQRPAQRAGDGAPGEGRRHADPARPALLGLLGRPAEAADAGRVGRPGPADAREHRARLHARRARRAERAGHAGGDAPARQRDPQRHAVADRAARLGRRHRLGQPGRAAARGGRGRARRARADAAPRRPLRPGRRQRVQPEVLRQRRGAARPVRRDRALLLPVLARHAVAAARERRRPLAALRQGRLRRRDAVRVDARLGRRHEQLRLGGEPAHPRLPGHAGRPARLREQT